MKLRLKYYPQKKGFSCGPTSLRMVFEHLGKKYSEEKMIKLCHAIPKHGISHKHMIEEVKNEGFKLVERDKGKIEDIINFLENGYPVIVNYLNPLSKRGHYSVIIGYNDKEKVLIFADPSNGMDFSLEYEEFKKRWHNLKNTSIGWYLVVGREKITL